MKNLTVLLMLMLGDTDGILFDKPLGLVLKEDHPDTPKIRQIARTAGVETSYKMPDDPGGRRWVTCGDLTQALGLMAMLCPTIDVAQAVGSIREVRPLKIPKDLEDHAPRWDDMVGAYRLPGRGQDMILPEGLLPNPVV